MAHKLLSKMDSERAMRMNGNADGQEATLPGGKKRVVCSRDRSCIPLMAKQEFRVLDTSLGLLKPVVGSDQNSTP